MDLPLRKTKAKERISCSNFWTAIQYLCTFLLSTYPAAAQVVAATTVEPIESLPLRDLSAISGNSASGSRFQVDLPDGTSCTSTNGTPPTLNLFSGYSRRQDKSEAAVDLVNRYSGTGNGYAVGAVFTYPLSTTSSRNCDEAYALNIANKKLELATFMYQEDLLTQQELRSLVVELKRVLFSDGK